MQLGDSLENILVEENKTKLFVVLFHDVENRDIAIRSTIYHGEENRDGSVEQ